ncbi:MAG: hypothetical protein IGBAC_2188 [Ignavibacteriae bacterium]|nr:MAG: hypothetical protein IGBAC_2188 [Ignavibacteriota bacterium]
MGTNYVNEGNLNNLVYSKLRKNVYFIVIVYTIIGGLWIYFSDELVESLYADVQTITEIQTFKGWIYVLITAILLFFMINRLYNQLKNYYEQALKNHTSLKLIFDHVGSIIWTVDKELRFTSSYGSGLKKLNLKMNEIVGKTLYEYFGVENDEFLPIASHLKAFKGSSVFFEIEWQGNIYHCHLEPLKEPNGEISSVIGVGVDITERKIIEDKLKNQLNELLQWKNVILNREEKIMELKKEVNTLLIEQGKPIKYSNV